MKRKNILSFIAIIILVSLNNNCFEYLTNQDVKVAQIMLYRGIFTFAIITPFALFKKEQLFPINFKQQSVRFITTGGSLMLILFSYSYLSAGTVSLLQRLDIPFLIFSSILISKKKNWLQISLSVIVVLFVLFLTLHPSSIDEEQNGFLLVFAGISLIVIGYCT